MAIRDVGPDPSDPRDTVTLGFADGRYPKKADVDPPAIMLTQAQYDALTDRPANQTYYVI